MACYIICFEKNGAFYDDFYNAIMSYENWAQIVGDTWALTSEATEQEVFDYLWQFMEANDCLFVVQSGGPSSWQNVNCDDTWLQEHL
ncbi:MAG: hypothetical protein RPS99_07380 [Gammaproteobacteria bacterium]|jgi:hypothetical protein